MLSLEALFSPKPSTMHQSFGGRAPPRPAGGAQAPQTLLAVVEEELGIKEGRGKGRERKEGREERKGR